MMWNLLYGTRQTQAFGNYYDLANLTERTLAATIERFPQDYWFDGTPLAEL